ncbi:MAG: hypothetical protein FWF59_05640 [Turicibacter sp.]|nr:hypothetical protein [Turicibacter sp.]
MFKKVFDGTSKLPLFSVKNIVDDSVLNPFPEFLIHVKVRAVVRKTSSRNWQFSSNKWLEEIGVMESGIVQNDHQFFPRVFPKEQL